MQTVWRVWHCLGDEEGGHGRRLVAVVAGWIARQAGLVARLAAAAVEVVAAESGCHGPESREKVEKSSGKIWPIC